VKLLLSYQVKYTETERENSEARPVVFVSPDDDARQENPEGNQGAEDGQVNQSFQAKEVCLPSFVRYQRELPHFGQTPKNLPPICWKEQDKQKASSEFACLMFRCLA